MAIQFACPKCGRQLRVPDSAVGKQSQCPKCENICEVSELYSKVPEPTQTPTPTVNPTPNPYADPPMASRPARYAAASVDQSARTWAMAGHLLGLSGAVIPFGNIIGPLVVWLMRRDDMPFAAEQAKESLNFQITLTIGAFVLAIAGIFTCGLTWVVLVIAAFAGMILPIIAGIKANELSLIHI